MRLPVPKVSNDLMSSLLFNGLFNLNKPYRSQK
jgi:hypothetical protein